MNADSVSSKPFVENNDCKQALKERYVEILKDCLKKLPEKNFKERAKYEAFIAHKKGDYERAEGYYIDFLNQNKDLKEEIMFSILLAELYVTKADFFQAIQYLSDANILNDKLDEGNSKKINRVKIKVGISNIFYYLNIEDEIIMEYQEVVKILEGINTKESKQIESEIFYTLSILFQKRNNAEKAFEYAEKSLSVSDDFDYLLGMGYGNIALAYANLLKNDPTNIEEAESLTHKAEEIFLILDLQDQVIFNIEILKININLKNSNYVKAKERLSDLELSFKNKLGVQNYLKSIYALYYQLYEKIDNKRKAIEYKWKEINLKKEIREEQDTEVIFKFKNKFINAEKEREKNDLEKEKLDKEDILIKEKEYNDNYTIIIYCLLTALLIFLLIALYFIIKRKQFMKFKREKDIESLNTNKTIMSRFSSNSDRDRRLKEKKSKYCMIAFKILDLEENLEEKNSNYVEYFYLYIENIIKHNLRKGDVLLKHDGKLLIVVKANIEESFYISLRLKKALSKNQLIKDNIYFGSVEMNDEEENHLDERYDKIETKLVQSMKKKEYVTI
jgi:hypothetical protein